MKPESLLARLVLFITLLLMAVWAAVALACWIESRNYINEFYDTQQMLFAKRLASASLGSITAQLPKTKIMLEGVAKKQRGKEDDDALSFAIFDLNGNTLLNDGKEGKKIIFTNETLGFINSGILNSDDQWRLLWLNSLDGTFRVAVGQELDYRWDMALDLLNMQLFPWLIALPLMLLGILWLVFRELKPLRMLTRKLNQRAPQDSGSLSLAKLPSEVVPLVKALNSLFARTGDMLKRERAFISDAAHELKTPLAALRVQAEVATLNNADEATKNKALSKLLHGIERCSRLMEQLLSLSRLEAIAQAGSGAHSSENSLTAWPDLLSETMLEIKPAAEKKGINLELNTASEPCSFSGEATLILLMLRNLLENAVKYSPQAGVVKIVLSKQKLTIYNSGAGVAAEHLPRLGERFFRPPGQTETGSGLGLSIVRRIAELHGFKVNFENIMGVGEEKISGFIVAIQFPHKN